MNMNMNELKGKRLIAAVAMLAMVMCVCVVAMPSEETDAALAEATALPEMDDVTKTITLTEDVDISTSKWFITEDMTLDLNGHTLYVNNIAVYTTNASDSLNFIINDSSANGTGKIVKAVGSKATSVIDVGEPSTDTLTMNGGTIDAKTLAPEGVNWYGIGVWTNGAAVLNGTKIISGSSCISGNGTQANAKIELNNVDFNSSSTSAVYFPSTETLKVTGGIFVGKMGFDIRAGTVTIDGATITANGTFEGGRNLILGVADDRAGIPASNPNLTPEIEAEVREVAQLIKDGSLVIQDTADGLIP